MVGTVLAPSGISGLDDRVGRTKFPVTTSEGELARKGLGEVREGVECSMAQSNQKARVEESDSESDLEV